MADIFGREPYNYRHLNRIKERSGEQGLRQYLRDRAGHKGTAHDFNFQPIPFHRHYTRDETYALAVGFMTNNLQAIQSMADEILYTEYRLPEFVPMKTNIPEGAKTYAYRVIDRRGVGRFITNDGTDSPSAAVSQRLVSYNVYYAGINAVYTLEDMRECMFAGLNLDSETMMAAVRGAMDHMETVGFEGDDAQGLTGLIDQPITGTNAVEHSTETAVWNTLTADAMLDRLQVLAGNLIIESKEVFGRNITGQLIVALPLEQANLVSNKRLPDITETVWSQFQMHNFWREYTGITPMLKPLQELDNAGSSNNDRMIMYIKDDRVFEMAVPISPRVLRVEQSGHSICTPLEYKFSGCHVKRPVAIQYVDGV